MDNCLDDGPVETLRIMEKLRAISQKNHNDLECLMSVGYNASSILATFIKSTSVYHLLPLCRTPVTMTVEYELKRVNSVDKNFADTERTVIPMEEGQKAWISQRSFLGIYCCLLLILVGLGVNIYFVTVLNPNASQPQGTADHGCTAFSNQALSANTNFASTVSTATHPDTADHDMVLMAFNKINELTMLIQSLNDTLSDVAMELTKDSIELGISDKQQSQQTLGRITETMNDASKAVTDLTDKLDRFFKMNCSQTNAAALQNCKSSLDRLDRIQDFVLSYDDHMEKQTETFETMLNETVAISKDQTGKKFDEISQKMDQFSMAVDLIMNKIDQLDVEAVSTRNGLSEINITLQKMMSDSLNLTMSNRVQNEALIQTNIKALTNLKTDFQDNFGVFLDRLDVFQQSTYDRLNDIDSMLNETHKVIDDKFLLETAMENEKSQIWQNLTTYFDDIRMSSLRQEHLLSRLYDSLEIQSTNISHQIAENCRGNEVVSMLENFTAVTTVGQQTLKNEVIHVFSQNQQQVRDSQEGLRVQITDLAQEVLRQNFEANCSAINDKLEKYESSCITVFGNVSEALNSLVAWRPTDQPAVQTALVSEIEVIKRLAQSISSSITFTSDKVRSATLSSAIVALLDDTKVIYEAVVNSSSSPVCRSDGCYIKTIPVGLTPSSTVVQKESVRLANAQISSGSIRGRLEVYRSGSWGTVCDDSFSNTDARVVCRMFGYSSGTQKQSAYFGAGIGAIHMDDVGCSGRETSIFSCGYTSNHNCGHSEDVGIICT